MRGRAGLGLYAEGTFDECDVILAEKPFFTAPRTSSTETLIKKLFSLDKEHLIRLLSSEAGSVAGTSAISAVFCANAIPCVEDEPDSDKECKTVTSGVFRYASRINHSCSPNAGWFWCSESHKLRRSSLQ